MINFISGIIIVAGLIIGIGVKLYFGDTPTERVAEEIIEKVVEMESGVDIEPIIDINDKPKQ